MINKNSEFYQACVEELKKERDDVLEVVREMEEEKITKIKNAVKSLLDVMKCGGEKGISVEFVSKGTFKVLKRSQGTVAKIEIECEDDTGFLEMCEACGMKPVRDKERRYFICL